MFKRAQNSCPNVLQLVDLLLSLSASSADCERGFSLAKVIKSDWKSRLRDTTVTNLMAIQLHILIFCTLIPCQLSTGRNGNASVGDQFAATLMLQTQSQ